MKTRKIMFLPGRRRKAQEMTKPRKEHPPARVLLSDTPLIGLETAKYIKKMAEWSRSSQVRLIEFARIPGGLWF